MHNHEIIFDVENTKIGIVESNCGAFNEEKEKEIQYNDKMFLDQNSSFNVMKNQTEFNMEEDIEKQKELEKQEEEIKLKNEFLDTKNLSSSSSSPINISLMILFYILAVFS